MKKVFLCPGLKINNNCCKELFTSIKLQCSKNERERKVSEEIKQTLCGLHNISELMGSGFFQLNEETESEMLDAEVIEMDTSEMHDCLNEAIAILEKIKGL